MKEIKLTNEQYGIVLNVLKEAKYNAEKNNANNYASKIEEVLKQLNNIKEIKE